MKPKPHECEHGTGLLPCPAGCNDKLEDVKQFQKRERTKKKAVKALLEHPKQGHTPTPKGPFLLPDLRCNNCLRYFREAEIQKIGCPDCKTDAYLMDMPEIERAVNSHEALIDALKLAKATIERLKPPTVHDSTQGTRDVIDKAISQAEGKL